MGCWHSGLALYIVVHVSTPQFKGVHTDIRFAYFHVICDTFAITYNIDIRENTYLCMNFSFTRLNLDLLKIEAINDCIIILVYICVVETGFSRSSFLLLH